MTDLATFVRIYDPSPTDELVEKREAAIKSALVPLRKVADSDGLLSVSTAVLEGFGAGSDGQYLTNFLLPALQKHSPSFVAEDREQELAVLSAYLVLSYLSANDTGATNTRKDIIAASLDMAFRHQSPCSDSKLERLRCTLADVAKERVIHRANIARSRVVTPRKLSTLESSDEPVSAEERNLLIQGMQALAANAILDREEIDMLWWALSGRSSLTGSSYESLANGSRAVIRGLELGMRARRLPAQAHVSLVLASVDKSEPISVSALLEDLPDAGEQLKSAGFPIEVASKYPAIFPLLASLMTGDAGLCFPKGAPDRKMTPDEWGERALFESALASICNDPQPKV